ncbi:MAG: hypothetical protein OEL57_02370 [Trichlorobacter sp.]|uniref:hypothetical protein n=1 Tax=Trichlorobacter sp. TaxID=2911007 RepID=UPI00255F3EB6|nr:hypothetical protein [Trichlorobacter sp.]MDK9716736.1 hypothetical protein [Trichlorobacter sp.]
MNKSKYIVVTQFHGLGRIHKVDSEIELTSDEASELASFIKPADGSAMPATTAQDTSLQKRITELEDELQKHQESLATLLDDHEAIFANYKQQIADLQAENEQLKAAAAKPAAKGAK